MELGADGFACEPCFQAGVEEALQLRPMDVLRSWFFQGAGGSSGTDDGDVHDGRIDADSGCHGQAQGTPETQARDSGGTGKMTQER